MVDERADNKGPLKQWRKKMEMENDSLKRDVPSHASATRNSTRRSGLGVEEETSPYKSPYIEKMRL
jgi:hypothetical protein